MSKLLKSKWYLVRINYDDEDKPELAEVMVNYGEFKSISDSERITHVRVRRIGGQVDGVPSSDVDLMVRRPEFDAFIVKRGNVLLEDLGKPKSRYRVSEDPLPSHIQKERRLPELLREEELPLSDVGLPTTVLEQEVKAFLSRTTLDDFGKVKLVRHPEGSRAEIDRLVVEVRPSRVPQVSNLVMDVTVEYNGRQQAVSRHMLPPNDFVSYLDVLLEVAGQEIVAVLEDEGGKETPSAPWP